MYLPVNSAECVIVLIAHLPFKLFVIGQCYYMCTLQYYAYHFDIYFSVVHFPQMLLTCIRKRMSIQYVSFADVNILGLLGF